MTLPSPAACRARPSRPLLSLAALALLGACAAPSPAPVPAAAPAATPTDSLLARRPIPHPVFEPPAFGRAVERGTRTRQGTPGPGYWQQYARYAISAELDPEMQRLTAQGTVTYYNRSPDTLRTVWVHLNQNLFAPNGVRNEVVPVTNGMEVFQVGVDGRSLAPTDSGMGYWIDATRMRVTLPAPLLPGATTELRFAWAFEVPPDGAPRSGSTGDVFMIAYWYPQVAVYDDVNGWHTDPYMGNAEFYMGYADYDVALTLPAGWLVTATGDLVNAGEVLSPTTQQRLAQARAANRAVVRVVTEGDRGPGTATQGARGTKLTWRFRAQNVRDFSFGASSQWLWDAAAALAGDRDGNGTPDTTLVQAFYRPQARAWAWENAARYAQHSVEFLSGYLWPYPYAHMTALDGPVSCSGMEYPMLTCIGGARDTLSLYSVLVHEIAHMWFPMQVGSDERTFAWMDEGLTRFNQAQGMQAFFPGYDREALARQSYLAIAGTGGEVELMRHGDRYPYGTRAYAVATYDKMAVNLMSLRGVLGDSTFLAAYRDYGQRWLGRHPTPHDFFYAFERSAGRDLDWLWSPWWYETWTLDQAVAEVRAGGGRAEIVVEDRGLVPMPIHLTVTSDSGTVRRVTAPVTVWLEGARRHVVPIDSVGTVTRVEIDAEQRFPDANRANNVWQRAAAPAIPAPPPR